MPANSAKVPGDYPTQALHSVALNGFGGGRPISALFRRSDAVGAACPQAFNHR